uniref:Uncharacterized protein n=1 Tax=Physcomitrium patens TaxID=3218 RepID=A0A2K1IHJ8_PHYPA|nr:hypothetical protein PHYPA_029350 [Physcomitrium patens]
MQCGDGDERRRQCRRQNGRVGYQDRVPRPPLEGLRWYRPSSLPSLVGRTYRVYPVSAHFVVLHTSGLSTLPCWNSLAQGHLSPSRFYCQ